MPTEQQVDRMSKDVTAHNDANENQRIITSRTGEGEILVNLLFHNENDVNGNLIFASDIATHLYEWIVCYTFTREEGKGSWISLEHYVEEQNINGVLLCAP